MRKYIIGIASQSMTLQTAADLLFQTLPDVEERMHLHVLLSDLLRGLP